MDPNVICWKGSHNTAASIAGIFLLVWALLLAMLFLRENRVSQTLDTTLELFDLLMLYGLAASVVFGIDQPSEVALMFVVASAVRTCLIHHPNSSSVRAVDNVWVYFSVTLFIMASFALLVSRSQPDLNSGVPKWNNLATLITLLVCLAPVVVVLLELPKKWMDEVWLKFESVVATSSAKTLEKWETVQLVVVKNQCTITKKVVHSHPRLMITVMKSKGGSELLKANGRINSRVVALDPSSLQPVNTNFLTYSFDTILSTATFRVQVIYIYICVEEIEQKKKAQMPNESLFLVVC
jgi:hypothetical protein